jgi:hypothetical protein
MLYEYFYCAIYEITRKQDPQNVMDGETEAHLPHANHTDLCEGSLAGRMTRA